MATDERNFRSTYYEKVGFKSVEEKRSLEILFKDRQINLIKLRQFCLRFGVPAIHRNYVWKILLGVLPLHSSCQNFVGDQRNEEYTNLITALQAMKVDRNLTKAEIFVAVWLLHTGKLRLENKFKDDQRGFCAVVSSMMLYFDQDVDVYWIAKTFYNNAQKFKCEVPKLIEATHALLEKEDLKLYKHLIEIDVLSALPFEEWFECCCAGVIGDMSLARIWDRIAGGSYKILVYTIVVMLTSLKHRLIKSKNLDDVLKIIDDMCEDTSEAAVNKSLELWQQHGSPLTIYDKPKP